MKVIYTKEQKNLILKTNLAYCLSDSVSDYIEDYTLDEIIGLATAKMKRVFKKHTKEKCEKGYIMNREDGEGGCYISESLGVHINSIDSMFSSFEIYEYLKA